MRLLPSVESAARARSLSQQIVKLLRRLLASRRVPSAARLAIRRHAGVTLQTTLLPERIDWLRSRLDCSWEGVHLRDRHLPLAYPVQVVEWQAVSVRALVVTGDLAHGLAFAIQVPLDELKALVEDVNIVLRHLLQVVQLMRAF